MAQRTSGRTAPLARTVLGLMLGGSMCGAEQAAAESLDITWHTVGAPGNHPWEDDRYPNHAFYGRGRVEHVYRMSETEVTAGQWIDFVRAYGPHADDPFEQGLLGWYISGSYQDGQLRYEVLDGFENHPTDADWRMAARFCNWMHNGRIDEPWAFEGGVYDTSTFTSNNDPPPFYNDEDTHAPDARYWIPTLDEWMKAVYYDPDKDGAGGWWEQPNGTDTMLIAEWPENGGETNAGLAAVYGGGTWDPRLHAGLYPDVRTPWGLLDASGGLREWTEEWTDPDTHPGRYVKGSNMDDWFMYDWHDWVASDSYSAPVYSIGVGVRLAAAVPTPSAGIAICAWLGLRIMRRRSRS
ncbi:MAG TPA: SUMF1/EgtB/PvdO family nonheme iron enzyme [Phycisphaerales bacterium]|nr:SUMF1/EgtB/PvdO family nonheme iron enzyme [Phycisphaerales bacterium]